VLSLVETIERIMNYSILQCVKGFKIEICDYIIIMHRFRLAVGIETQKFSFIVELIVIILKSTI